MLCLKVWVIILTFIVGIAYVHLTDFFGLKRCLRPDWITSTWFINAALRLLCHLSEAIALSSHSRVTLNVSPKE